jgi:hypothetical protein
MARTAVTTAKKPGAKGAPAGRAVKPAEKKAEKPAKGRAELSPEEEDELSSLAGAAKEHEAEIRLQEKDSGLYVTLVQGNSGILLEGDPRYIKGVKLHDYVITQRKLRLGATLDATVIGHFKLYEEKNKKEKDNDMAKTVRFWMPEQAEQIPLASGKQFERPLANGNVLMPIHWVFLHLHQFPDLEGAKLSFRSTGNTVYKQLIKLLNSKTEICTELRFTIGKQGIRSETYKNTSFYPEFNEAGRNFEYRKGRLTAVEGGLDKDTIKLILEQSKEIQEDYTACRLVTKLGQDTMRALIGAPEERRALPMAHTAPDDGDHETATF